MGGGLVALQRGGMEIVIGVGIHRDGGQQLGSACLERCPLFGIGLSIAGFLYPLLRFAPYSKSAILLQAPKNKRKGIL